MWPCKWDHGYHARSIRKSATLGRVYVDGLSYPSDGIKLCSGDDGNVLNPRQKLWLADWNEKDLARIKFPCKFYFLHILAGGPGSQVMLFPGDPHYRLYTNDAGCWPVPAGPGEMKIQGILLKDSTREAGAYERCGAFELNLYEGNRRNSETGSGNGRFWTRGSPS